ncbi:hypothetical protein D3C76_1659580 [compost metagenome]
MVHALDQSQFSIGLGRFKSLGVTDIHLYIVGALDNQCRYFYLGKRCRRVLAQ